MPHAFIVIMYYILKDYYKSGVITIPASESIQEVKEACDYMMIPFNEKTIRTSNLSKSDMNVCQSFCTVVLCAYVSVVYHEVLAFSASYHVCSIRHCSRVVAALK